MRIAVVHNAYKLRGGEDAVVENETKLLSQAGHDVTTFIVSNDEIAGIGAKLRIAVNAIHSFRIQSEFTRHLREARPDVVHVGITGTHPDYRGRGIAFALKLLTIDYARQHGIREIRTQNDTRNEPMLHINQSVGFVTEPPWIVYERRFDGQ